MTRAAIASAGGRWQVAGGRVTRKVDDCVTSDKHMLDSVTTVFAAH